MMKYAYKLLIMNTILLAIYFLVSTIIIHIVDSDYPTKIFIPSHSIYHITQPLYYNIWAGIIFSLFFAPTIITIFSKDYNLIYSIKILLFNALTGITIYGWLKCVYAVINKD